MSSRWREPLLRHCPTVRERDAAGSLIPSPRGGVPVEANRLLAIVNVFLAHSQCSLQPLRCCMTWTMLPQARQPGHGRSLVLATILNSGMPPDLPTLARDSHRIDSRETMWPYQAHSIQTLVQLSQRTRHNGSAGHGTVAYEKNLAPLSDASWQEIAPLFEPCCEIDSMAHYRRHVGQEAARQHHERHGTHRSYDLCRSRIGWSDTGRTEIRQHGHCGVALLCDHRDYGCSQGHRRLARTHGSPRGPIRAACSRRAATISSDMPSSPPPMEPAAVRISNIRNILGIVVLAGCLERSDLLPHESENGMRFARELLVRNPHADH